MLNLDTTDPKWTSRRCVAAREAVCEDSDHGTTRAVLGLAGKLVVPFAGAAGSLARSKAQEHKRAELNRRVETACVSRRGRRSR